MNNNFIDIILSIIEGINENVKPIETLNDVWDIKRLLDQGINFFNLEEAKALDIKLYNNFIEAKTLIDIYDLGANANLSIFQIIDTHLRLHAFNIFAKAWQEVTQKQ